MTLPQLAAVCKSREQRENEGVITNPTDAQLARLLAANRARDDQTVADILAGRIR